MTTDDKRIYYKFHSNFDIPELEDNLVYVFGSNERGLHGAGAALIARDKFGAINGVYTGLMGNCYGIPTKDKWIRSLLIKEILPYIAKFRAFTHERPDLNFWVTGVGCGLAGFKPRDIAPLFRGCNDNCSFNENWKPFLTNVRIPVIDKK